MNQSLQVIAQSGGEKMEMLKNGKPEVQEQAIRDLILEHKVRVKELRGMLADVNFRKKSREAVFGAIRLLGEYRAVEAVEELASLIDLDEGHDPDVLLPPEQEYPALNSIIRIGKPSVGVLLRRVSEGESKGYQAKLIGYAIMRIEGGKEEAKKIIENHARGLPLEKQRVLTTSGIMALLQSDE